MSATRPLPPDVPTARPGCALPPQAQTLLLVGNPNVGKSVVFGFLTGRYATVSNYPGTTVEITRGRPREGGGEVIDLPGANGLLPTSPDEEVTRDFLLERLGRPDVSVIQVCDAKNLRRGLAITVQLAELELPAVLVANMLDEASARGLHVDVAGLAAATGLDVRGTVATRRQGLAELAAGSLAARVPSLRVDYGEVVEAAVRDVSRLLPPQLSGKRGVALMLLAGDASLRPWAVRHLGDRVEAVEALRLETERRTPEGVRSRITRVRLRAAEALAGTVTRAAGEVRGSWLRRLGDLTTHPWLGLPVAAAALYLVYLFVGVLGAGEVVDFVESELFARFVTPGVDRGLRFLLPGPLESLLVGPPGVEPGTGPGLLVGDYGLVSMALSYAVAIVLPIVGFFFVAFSIMEDSGYLPRLAVVLNRGFRAVGLNGKAVLPMVLGLGCGTMATMTARILPSRKERVLVTLLLALGVPCSAQLGVILGMLAGLSLWGALVWGGAVLGVMLLVALIAGRLLPGETADFVLELPPMRRPQLGNVLVKTLARVEWYLREAVPLFVLATFMLWTLDRTGALAGLQRAAAPVVEGLLGLPAAASEAFLIGFLRRDYGAAGLFAIFQESLAAGGMPVVTQIQIVVAMITITLFVPCVATVMMIAKERGVATALAMTAFIFPFAFAVGGLVNFGLRAVLL